MNEKKKTINLLLIQNILKMLNSKKTKKKKEENKEAKVMFCYIFVNF